MIILPDPHFNNCVSQQWLRLVWSEIIAVHSLFDCASPDIKILERGAECQVQRKDHRQLVRPTNMKWTNWPKWNCKSCKDRYVNTTAAACRAECNIIMTKCQQECRCDEDHWRIQGRRCYQLGMIIIVLNPLPVCDTFISSSFQHVMTYIISTPGRGRINIEKRPQLFNGKGRSRVAFIDTCPNERGTLLVLMRY